MSFLGSLFSKEKKDSLDKGLEKTKDNFFSKLGKTVIGKSTVDEEVLDNLEEALVSSDVGIDTTLKIIDRIQKRVGKDKYLGTAELDIILREEVSALLTESNNLESSDFDTPSDKKPYVIMVVGVNGVGKTTTIGKLSSQFKRRGKTVLLGAADTFRAAAVDQLKIWGERVGIPVVAKGMNTDPSAVAFEAVMEGVKQGVDVVIIDTAGRLHTKVNLMQELSKIKRTIEKVIPDAPHDIMLVLDGSTGQNAIIQAREFTKATDVSCLAITKLDGTAKGGVVIGISDEFKIPVKYIGVGEKIDDLQVFNKMEFVNSLFGK
jgi:fused signal recognition particle receptor